MSALTLKERCRINTNKDADNFVGIKMSGGEIEVSFPLGYRLEDTEKGLRKDIVLLLNTLSKHSDRKDSEFNKEKIFIEVDIPIRAYMYIISDYYSRGYYKETEPVHNVAKRGKINWNRTIKTQKSYVQEDGIFYLDFVTRRNNINDNEMISLIHKYCVYESFSKIGWIYTDSMPEKPQIPFNKKLFSAVIRKKISETFNDRNKRLFRNMLAVVASIGDDGPANNYMYGTHRFEYVWESMIDKTFGIVEKERFFPRTRWVIGGKTYRNSTLEPDTIMIHNGIIYVLDAKYYKYGWSGAPSHLPDSSSISKQITYGEYIAESEDFVDENGKHPTVYNAFIMPYDSFGETFHMGTDMHYVGEAISDWKSSDGTKSYEKIEGVLLDVKSLMLERSSNKDKIMELANLIASKAELNH